MKTSKVYDFLSCYQVSIRKVFFPDAEPVDLLSGNEEFFFWQENQSIMSRRILIR